jgi:uncharacterized Zn finger protein
MGRSWEDRVDEYVDSPRMRERIKVGSTLICRIQGNSGVYRTQASIGRKKESECTCPSAELPPENGGQFLTAGLLFENPPI